MIKNKKILLGVILILIIIASVFGASFIKFKSKNNKWNDDKEKTVSEVRYLETKLTSLLNAMNNIKYENYKVMESKIDETESSSNSTKSSGRSDSSNMNSGESKSKTSSQSSGESDSEQTGEEKESSQTKYTLEKTSTLSNSSKEINWDKIKSEVEILYSVIPTTTLDLYSLNIDQNEILQFNKDFDNLTSSVKNEDKEKTLERLSKLYGYLPKYLEKIYENETYTNIVKTKSYVVSAYSIVDTENWNQISEYVKKAIESYSSVLNNITTDSKTYNVNKGYILLNELQNAVNMKDKEIFLIKYKNLLEEFNSI
mgnify:FL=1